ncbi:hypothetical protein EVA_02074 [gut metagenome]|uniref:Uncharacterized protein n=1 Tax=gut metagenome TaxID=749906 RepID=J9H6Q8_9ZZZZ
MAGFFHVFVVRNVNLLENQGWREHGAREEEAGEVVVRQVVAEGFFRNLMQLVLEVFEVVDAEHLFSGIGVDDDEVAEAEMLHDLFSQVLGIALGIFADKGGVELFGIADIGFFAGFQYDGNFRIALLDVLS